MAEFKNYKKEYISVGDQGSKILYEITSKTLQEVDNLANLKKNLTGMNSSIFLEIPPGYSVIVHTQTASPCNNHYNLGQSLVENLLKTHLGGSTPIGFANVIDSRTGQLMMVEAIANGMTDLAIKNGLYILNGENAIYGQRVSEVNLSGTMISIIPSDKLKNKPGIIENNGVKYANFNPKGKLVMINSDGTGTKPEFQERAKKYCNGIDDWLAMILDDVIKVDAQAVIASGVLEYSKNIPLEKMQDFLEKRRKELAILATLQIENLEGKILSYDSGLPVFNISGSLISVIDANKINNLPQPMEGDSLIAIQGSVENPRSNGNSARRKLMMEIGGKNWHEQSEYKKHLEYLSAPSTIFYPIMKKLFDEKLITSFYHMSGGAFNGKLAKPLAKHQLFAQITNLFEPSSIEQELCFNSNSTLQDAYETSHMGNEAFITTKNATKVIENLTQIGYKAREVAKLQSGNTGVLIKTQNGEEIRFTGLD